MLEAGQFVHARVAYDGADPADLPPDQREIAAMLFGPEVLRVPPMARRCIASIIGGRSGKTYIAVARLLHLCCTASLAGILATGERAHAVIVCPDVDTAMQALVYFVGFCADHPSLRGCIPAEVVDKVIKRGEAVESVLFRRPVDGLFVEVEVKSVRQGGANVRGRWYVGALLDEACLFYGDGYKLTDEAVFKAVAPRIVAGGQILLSSTPWQDSGILYRLWETEYGRPQTALVAHAPTLLLRPDDPHTAETVATEYARDPENARREFGAEFGTGAPSDWLDRGQLKAAGAAGPQVPACPGEEVAAGGDLGFARNSSALAVAVRDPKTGKIRIPLLVERRPVGGKPLRPSVVCGEFAGMVRGAGAEELLADRHYAETAREALSEADLLLGDTPPADVVWSTVRQVIRDGLLAFDATTPEGALLAAQLASAKGRKVAKGKVSILLPETKDGRHCDLAEAAAKAIWGVLNRPTMIPLEQAAKGSAEREAAERAERLDAWRARRARERAEASAGGWQDGEGEGFGAWQEAG